MTSRVLVVGDGVLVAAVLKLLDFSKACEVIHESQVPSQAPVGVELALVLDDAWRPSVHALAENVFRAKGLPWLRGFVAFGHGFIGPLVRPTEAGCSFCADMRTLMADVDRREMWQFRMQLATGGGLDRDVWATRTGLLHMANALVAEVERILCDIDACRVVDHVICTNLSTFDTERHFILPNAACPVCGTLPDDSPEAAVIPLDASPKVNKNSFRSRSIQALASKLAHDYLDYGAGLLNGKVQDLITPFAAVSVNLPLLLGDEGTSGRAHSYEECEVTAILEGLERYCGLEPRGKQTVVCDTYANLKDCALDPRTVGLHDPRQYLRPDFPFQAFDDDLAMDWVWGYSLTSHRPILVPQRFAYYSLGGGDGVVYETSNGCALGGTLVEAIFHGILEIVERDAFLMTWYAKLPLPAIDLAGSPDIELQWMIERIRSTAGYDLHCFNATMENGIPTVFVIAKNRRASGLHLLCSAGAHLDPMRAIKGAIQETAGMLLRFDEKLEAERDTYLRMLHEPALVQQMGDHSMLYGLPEAEQRLGFLLEGERSVQTIEEAFHWGAVHSDLRDDLQDLLDAFERLQLDVIVVNQTSPELERNGLYCVKVIIPGMLPMTFGYHLTRLEHLDRVLTVPMTLGYTDKPLTRDQLNSHPHPFP